MSDLFVTITSRTTKRQFDEALARLNKAMFKPSDISRFVGTVQLHEDPVEYQRKIRDDEPVLRPTGKGRKK